MKKILPCAFPPITSYPLIANMMSVLWTYKENTLPWISDRFIQLIGRKDTIPNVSTVGTFYEYETNYNRPMFLSCPYLYSSRIDRSVLTQNITSFTEFTKKCIDDDYYLHACLDHYYFSDSPIHKKEQYVHPTFIYGYDDTNDQVRIRDFFKEKYREGMASYTELDQAYENVEHQFKFEYLNYISIFKYRPVYYKINISKIIYDYEDYINSRDSRNVYREDYIYKTSELAYGLEYYDFLSNILSSKAIDLRAFHVLVDHKTVQKIRIHYLESINCIKNIDRVIEAHDTLEKNCVLLRNVAIKAILTKNLEVISKGQQLCQAIKEIDKNFVMLLLASISG